ncbi:hypothetical protein ACIQZG_02485 [Lysinibacillus sp. NPDC096418]|uniref:hypothetical protein n=1 Tax=Lysinibacillus sp. NPDC096418 TaxID=3364138 RepID=UPI00381FAC90
MDALKLINNQIVKEKTCIDDLTKEIVIHTNDGRYGLAADRGRDMQNSIMRIQQPERQKGLYLTAIKFASQGINAEVVKRSVQA